MDIEKHAQMMRWLTRPKSPVPGPRNMNQGGVIGKPGGVVEPGVMYYGKNVMSGSKAQQAGNIKKQQVKFDRIAKLFKDEDWTGLKTKTRPARIKEGTQVDTGGKLISQDTKMLTDIIDGGTLKEKNALAKKLGITREKMIEGWEKSKAKIATEKSAKMKKMRFTPDVEFQQKLYNEISTNPATIKEMAKRLKVDEKYLVKQSSKLLKNVYTQNVAIAKGPEFDLDARGKATLKSWLPDDFKSTDKFLDNFANIDGLKKVQTENMGILIRNAYRNNPKKYTEALKILGDYNKFVNSLPKGMKVDLDHPLSKAFLKGSGVSPDKLLYVTPVDRGFNRGFKKQLGDKYTQALNMTDPILKKEAIKNVRTLADKTGINIGDVTGKKYDYGTTHLLDKKKNFQKEFFKNLKEQNLVAENLKTLKKTKEGKKIIKNVFPTGKVAVKFLSSKHQKLIREQFCGNKDGLSPGSCPIDEAIDNMVKQTNNVKRGAVKGAEAARIASKASKVARFGTGAGLAKVLGPYGLAAEAVFEVGLAVPGYVRGESGKRLLGDSILGLIPGVGQSAEEEFTEYATKAGMSELEQQKIKDANRFSELSENLYKMEQAGILEGRGAGRGGQHRGINKFMELQEEYIPLYNQFVGAPPSESVDTMFAKEDRINQSIEEAKAVRRKQRQDSGIVAQDDWYTNVNTRGYAEGGIMGLKKKW
jgi:hypothetical protein